MIVDKIKLKTIKVPRGKLFIYYYSISVYVDDVRSTSFKHKFTNNATVDYLTRGLYPTNSRAVDAMHSRLISYMHINRIKKEDFHLSHSVGNSEILYVRIGSHNNKGVL